VDGKDTKVGHQGYEENGYIYDHNQPMQTLRPSRLSSRNRWSPRNRSSTAEHSDFATIDDLQLLEDILGKVSSLQTTSYIEQTKSIRVSDAYHLKARFQGSVGQTRNGNLLTDVLCFCTRSNPEVSRSGELVTLRRAHLARRIWLHMWAGLRQCSSDIRTVSTTRPGGYREKQYAIQAY
jgi:hypothetical protein